MENTEKTSKYEHLSLPERQHLAYLYNRDNRGNLREIGIEMKRSHNTIALEIRSGLVGDTYEPLLGEKKAKNSRKRSKTQTLNVVKDPSVHKIVNDRLRKRISPDRISGELKKDGKNFSGKCIYNYAYSRGMEYYLCFKGKERRKKGVYNYRKAKELDKTRIKDRPDILGIYGHYEMDFIVCSQSKETLLVVVEKKNRTVYVKRIPNRTHVVVTQALKEMLAGKLILSITTDNDIAFSNWREIERVLNTKMYFCEPYHSWEKGLVENTNRWIRLFVKKKSDIALVTDEKIREILAWFNDYPRAIIGYMTSNELELAESCTTKGV